MFCHLSDGPRREDAPPHPAPRKAMDSGRKHPFLTDQTPKGRLPRQDFDRPRKISAKKSARTCEIRAKSRLGPAFALPLAPGFAYQRGIN